MIPKLKEKKVAFAEIIERLRIFMPDLEFYKGLQHSDAHPSPAFVHECVLQWKEQLSQLRQKRPTADIKLGLFKGPAFLGASFLDWERPGGRIHVSAYVWNIPTPKCPGYDLEWLTKNPSLSTKLMRGDSTIFTQQPQTLWIE